MTRCWQVFAKQQHYLLYITVHNLVCTYRAEDIQTDGMKTTFTVHTPTYISKVHFAGFGHA